MSVPVWLIILSDQLPIIALVGLYPTNQLIGRRPLPKRLTAFLHRSHDGAHAVLAPLSRSYPPLQGRSPTCYSPGRHWPQPESQSPCDLHGLCTPPAFILSQDQTLHPNSNSLSAASLTYPGPSRFLHFLPLFSC